MLFLARGVDGLERVVDESLRSADCPGHVEPAIEVPKVLGCLERLFERGLRETQRGTEPLELAGVDLAHVSIIALVCGGYARRV
jgi:hypothetical protein